MSDISKLLYVIPRAFRRVKFETILKYSGIYAKYHVQIMLLFVYTATRYFKLSKNTTAVSQSNCRNFSCSSVIIEYFDLLVVRRSFESYSCLEFILKNRKLGENLWKVWTQETFQKKVEFDRPGERSPE